MGTLENFRNFDTHGQQIFAEVSEASEIVHGYLQVSENVARV